MAIFRDEANPWNQLDWSLLQNGPITMYFRRAFLDEDCAWLADHSYVIDRFDCTKWTDETRAHHDLATTLGFPDYYGNNLDAFNDCMSYLKIPDVGGRVLVFERFDTAVRSLGETATVVLDVIADQARRHLLFGQRLLALVQTDDAELSFPPLAPTLAGWNPREWLAAARAK